MGQESHPPRARADPEARPADGLWSARGRPEPPPASRLGYSPITAQRKPIMMKNPLNSAISPSAPYGEFAPSCGTN
jgi:hypothetical protein